jgi:hypothetical protein
MASVIESLNATLEMQLIDSIMFHDLAYDGYRQSGRGAMVTRFANIGELDSEEQVMSFFVPREALVQFDYAEVVHLIDMYDPAEHYVALATVDIRRPGPNKDNAIMLCKMIHRDLHLYSLPDYDIRGISLRSSRVEIAAHDSAAVRCHLKCARIGCKAADNLKICAGCKDARYCSKVCQIEDRDAHRQKCQQLKAAKLAALDFLSGHKTS